MTGLGLVRTLSLVGVSLAGGTGAEGNRPTDGKIKAPPPGLALVVGWTRQFCRLFALSCRRLQSIGQPFQRAHRHRQADAAENSLDRP